MKRGMLQVTLGLAALAGVLYAQRAWSEYPAFEYNDFPIPPDYYVVYAMTH